MLRFVILEHDHPHRHWDLMLEAGQILRTWRLAQPPQTSSAVKAERSFDHRLLYLDYEGPVSGERGHVARWDFGTFRWLEDKPGAVVISLRGHRLQGCVRLRHAADEEWLLTVEPVEDDQPEEMAAQ
jgi:hypothetical protein